MANISRDTFDKLKHYVGVRLQQGVPILDADWNEMEDIRKHELRTFLKWFVGNGVPKGNDGFRILPASDGLDNDFTIRGGINGEPGYCLVEGWDVMIKNDIKYTEQQLYNNEALAQEWGVLPLRCLDAPQQYGEHRNDIVYLDVWEREVDSLEDNNLVNSAIDIETCVRLKREWVVRVAEGVTHEKDLPQHLEANNIFRPGHVCYPLARLKRNYEGFFISGSDIYDWRRTGLTVSPEEITVKNGNVGIGTTNPGNKLEVNGGSAKFVTADGDDPLKISRFQRVTPGQGEQELRIGVEDKVTTFHYINDESNNRLDFRMQNTDTEKGDGENENDNTVMSIKGDTDGGKVGIGTKKPKNKLDVGGGAAIGAGYSGTNTAPENGLLIEGNVGIGTTNPGTALEVNGSEYPIAKFKREGGQDLAAALDLENSNGKKWNIQSKGNNNFVINENEEDERFVIEKDTGNVGIGITEPEAKLDVDGDVKANNLTVMQNNTQQIKTDTFGDSYSLDRDAQPNLKVNLRDAINAVLGGGFPTTTPERVPTDTTGNFQPYTLKDSSGNIWVFWGSGGKIWCKRWVNGSWEVDEPVSTGDGPDSNPYALEDSNGNIWVFWESFRDDRYDIFCKWGVSGNWRGDEPVSTGSGENRNPYALEDSNGNIWVFWESYDEIGCKILHNIQWANGSNSGWAGEQELITDTIDTHYVSEQSPYAFAERYGKIYVFWESYINVNFDIFCDQWSAGYWIRREQLTEEATSDSQPYALKDRSGNIWVFWRSNRTGQWEIWYKHQVNRSWEDVDDEQLTAQSNDNCHPFFVLEDRNGNIWVLWQSERYGKYELWCNRFINGRPVGDTQLHTAHYIYSDPHASEDSEGNIWVFWNTDTVIRCMCLIIRI